MKWFFPLLALVACLPQHAFADTTLGTVIAKLPHVITKGGVYRLTKDLGFVDVTGNAISVDVTDVVIDLNGFEIIAVSGSANNAVGIKSSLKNRVTIKNGTIRGFEKGVVIGGDDARVSDLLLVNNLETGVSVTGNHAQIIHNRVFDTGGSTNGGVVDAEGITLTGTYGTISDNDVELTFQSDTTGHFADGIQLLGCSDIIVSNNRVLDVEPAVATKGKATGIIADPAASSDAVVFLGNTVVTTEIPFDLSGGLSGKYGDNVTSDFTAPSAYVTSGTGMVNIGNN